MTKHTKKLTIGLIVSLIGPAMIFAGCGRSIDSIEITEASNENRFAIRVSKDAVNDIRFHPISMILLSSLKQTLDNPDCYLIEYRGDEE